MIGNSFSICVGRNLPKLIAHEKKHNIDITNAYIGGCPLSLHAKNLRKAEADPSFKPYVINTWNSKDLRKNPVYQYKVLSEKELAKFVRPNVPSHSGDVVGKHFRQKTFFPA